MSAPQRIAGRIQAYAQQQCASISRTVGVSAISYGSCLPAASSTAFPSLGSPIPFISTSRMYCSGPSFNSSNTTAGNARVEDDICTARRHGAFLNSFVPTLSSSCQNVGKTFFNRSAPLALLPRRITHTHVRTMSTIPRGNTHVELWRHHIGLQGYRFEPSRRFSLTCASNRAHGGSFAEKHAHFMTSSPWRGAMALQVRTRRCRGGKIKTKLRREARRQRRDQKGQMKDATNTTPPSINLG